MLSLVAAAPVVDLGELGREVVLVDLAAALQRVGDVERHLRVVGEAPAAVARRTEEAPQQAFEWPTFVRRAQRIAEGEAEHGAAAAVFEVGSGRGVHGVGVQSSQRQGLRRLRSQTIQAGESNASE